MLTWYYFLPVTADGEKAVAIGEVIEETDERILLKVFEGLTYDIDRRAIFSDEDVIEP